MQENLRIAYMMHIDWAWIKQRPHFIYEGLANFYDIDLYYISRFYDSRNTKLKKTAYYAGSKDKIITKLPYSGRFKFIKKVEKYLNQGKFYNLDQYDYIWITSPLLLEYVPIGRLEGKNIIYDCMDNFTEFHSLPGLKQKAECLEMELIKMSNKIIVSSSALQRKISINYRDVLKTKPVIINNALNREWSRKRPTSNDYYSPNGDFNIMYIGTVGEWFDFDAILAILEEFPNSKVTLVGPVDSKRRVRHPRLIYFGSVNHDVLPNYASKADALIMPFKLNELVKGVDPVKLYEYISFRKPIISIFYEETVKFDPFVEFYNSYEELSNIIQKLMDHKITVRSEHEIMQFLEQNTWDTRVHKIVTELL